MKITKKTTIRELLQIVGTESIRDNIHPNIHVAALFADYKPVDSGLKNPYSSDTYPEYNEWEIWFSKQMPNWIITDLRFPNELEAVKKRNGTTIRVHCDYVRQGEAKATRVYPEKGEHPSETALDDAKFDYTIDNNGTIEELVEELREILTKEKII